MHEIKTIEQQVAELREQANQIGCLMTPNSFYLTSDELRLLVNTAKLDRRTVLSVLLGENTTPAAQLAVYQILYTARMAVLILSHPSKEKADPQ